MDWARRRQTLYAIGVVLALVGAVALFWYVFFYAPPSCSDNIINQGEGGVDCGGPCARMCVAPRVDALWTRPVKVADGVYHGVALIKNPLADASGTTIEYQLSLYDAGNILIAAREGTFDILPGQTRTLFEANIITGSRVPVRAFTIINNGSWRTAEPQEVPLSIVTQELDQEALTLTATIENTSARTVTRIVADALLYNSDNILIAASETKVASLSGRERKEISFTWSTLFPSPVARADIELRIDDAPRP
jgi:hypothetical protein